MPKTYPELLGEWVQQRDSTKRDRNLVAFLAVRDDVRAALDAGYTVRTVWTHLYDEKRVRFGYETFLKYVNGQIRRPTKDHAKAQANGPGVDPIITPTRAQVEAGPKQSGLQAKSSEAMPGFTFNAAPKMEDLI